MTAENTSWDDIPSLDNLTIDWEFEPENALGKRAWVRIDKSDLRSFLTMESIPVKVITRNFDKSGQLVDLSVGGLAVLLSTKLTDGQLVKVGFFLGRQKIISRAVVRNICSLKDKYRVGMEFMDLEKDTSSYVAGIISSKIYKI